MEEENLEKNKGDEKPKEEEEIVKGGRHVVEQAIATQFFREHKDHMPAILQLRADILEEGEYIVLKAKIPGVSEDEVEVTATEHSIDVSIPSEEEESPITGEKEHHPSTLISHNSYLLTEPIDPESLEVSFEGDKLIVKARLMK